MSIVFREDRDHRNKRTRSWHRGNPARSYALAAKGRANRAGVPFDITEEDVIFPDVCPVLGIPLVLSNEDRPKIRTDNTPSLDRIIPELGYVKGNIEIISWRANRLKNDASYQEIESLYNYMKRSRGKVWSGINFLGERIRPDDEQV